MRIQHFCMAVAVLSVLFAPTARGEAPSLLLVYDSSGKFVVPPPSPVRQNGEERLQAVLEGQGHRVFVTEAERGQEPDAGKFLEAARSHEPPAAAVVFYSIAIMVKPEAAFTKAVARAFGRILMVDGEKSLGEVEAAANFVFPPGCSATCMSRIAEERAAGVAGQFAMAVSEKLAMKPGPMHPARAARQCDQLATDPHDPGKKASGTKLGRIDTARAVPACQQAVDAIPREPRLGYQLGRALEAAGKYDLAVAAYRKAAEYAPAMFRLGFLYKKGEGVAKDAAKAVEWFRKAADKGYTDAQFHLGVMYEEGTGVAQDYKEAYFWMVLAQYLKHRGAGHAIDAIADKLTKSEIVQARIRASGWMADWHRSQKRK